MPSGKSLPSGDNALIDLALAGDKSALESLIHKHQNWVYNTALAMVAHADDAADITQEVLIKVITKLSTFKKQSEFRTWMYRIIKNHFLNMKRARYEETSLTFEQFGEGLDAIPDALLKDYPSVVERQLLIEEAKLSCMKAMLLCLDREQRLIFILGELFEFPDSVGSEVMDLSKENFRIKLYRAKKQLYNFMHSKCGLINQNNPCRCAKKTSGFIKLGYVDPIKKQFQKERISTIEQALKKKVSTFDEEVSKEYRQLYQKHPFLKGPDGLRLIKKLLSSRAIKETFNFE